MMQKKRVIAQLFIKPNSILEFKNMANGLIKKTREEKGCHSYCLYQDILDSNQFVFVEEYSNQEALNIHFNSEYLKEFVANISNLQLKEMIIDIIDIT